MAEKQSGDEPLPKVTPPELRQIWEMSPEFLPNSGNGAGDDGYKPYHTETFVHIGEMVDTQNELLKVTATQVSEYEVFRKHLRDTRDWIFAVTGPEHVGADGNYVPEAETWKEAQLREMSAGHTPGSQNTQGKGHLPESAHYFGAPKKEVERLQNHMDNLMLAVADSIHLVGEFIATLHVAGKAYSTAEFNALMPAPETHGYNAPSRATPV